MTSEIDTAQEVHGASRRAFLRRSAVVGGSLLWAAPTVQLLDLSAKAAATTSGHHCVATPPSSVFFLLRIKSTPHGCNPKWGTGQCMGFQWTPGVGFSPPRGTNIPLNLPGTPRYDCTSLFYKEVLSSLNMFKSLVTVTQTSIISGHVSVPSYSVALSNDFFTPVSSHGASYCGYSLNANGTSFSGYSHNNPHGYDSYTFQGYSACSLTH